MRILVIEDDQGLGELIEEVLTDQGHEAEWTGDGALAARLALEFGPHVILLDYVMTPLDGPAVAAALRAQPATSTIPIVLMTGAIAPEAKAREVGAAGLVLKPFDLDDLAPALLRACVGPPELMARAS
jgi:DNA-binding response OmpR family regulator